MKLLDQGNKHDTVDGCEILHQLTQLIGCKHPILIGLHPSGEQPMVCRATEAKVKRQALKAPSRPPLITWIMEIMGFMG
jgi:hypothetical protein